MNKDSEKRETAGMLSYALLLSLSLNPSLSACTREIGNDKREI